ncbi:MAG: hypothetical protein KF819_29805 [Labilithrix sp.]|nr:hypothetical protein [Labilithrix sp.]
MSKQILAAALCVAAAFVLVPASPAKADDGIALEGSQCWGRCNVCTSRCNKGNADDRERCERSCFAGNDGCCTASGRHGAPRACGCY